MGSPRGQQDGSSSDLLFPSQLHGQVPHEGLALGFMLCHHQLKILNNF